MASGPDAPRVRHVGLAAWSAVVIVAAFYLWTVHSIGGSLRFGQEQRDYYNLLIDGYLDGQLHMKVDVPEALRRVADPYDPAQRPPGSGLHDASYYQGRYYVYFGAAPMVVLMLPFRILTGTDLPLAAATLAFVALGFGVSAGLWLAVRRRYFPETGGAVTFLALLVLGLTAGGPVLLRRPDMWELPLAGGSAFAMVSLGCLWRALHDGGRLRWWAAAGLALGLAIASRPTYLVAAPLFAAPLGWWWRTTRRFPWSRIGAIAGPLALVGGLMALHNYARFGDPLQFGQAYQLSLDYESKLPHFRAAYVPYTARTYFFGPAEWSSYFPFIRPGDTGPAPAGFTMHRGHVYGLLLYFPFAWLALGAPAAAWLRRRESEGRLGAWMMAAGLLGAGVGTMLLFFFSALARYESDFVPAIILLATLGLLAVEHGLRRSGVALRWLGRGVWGTLAVASLLFAVLFSLTFDGLLAEHNPALARQVARTLNRIPAAFERLRGVRHGPVGFTFRLPEESRVGRETLLTRGQPPSLDRVFLATRPDGRRELGVTLADTPEIVSAPLALEPGSIHRLELALGSLLPPPEHPWFAGRTAAEIRRAQREVRVELDGRAVIDEGRRRGAVGSRELRVGAAAWPDPAYPHFRGTVDEVRRRDVTGAPAGPDRAAGNEWAAAVGGQLRVRFPRDRAGQSEPLLVTGRSGAGDLVIVQYLDGTTVRFAHDHWGAPLQASPSVSLDLAEPHVIEVTLGSLPPVEDASQAPEPRKGRLRVRLDGRVVWETTAYFHPTEAAEVALGRNPIGGTSAGPAFTGEVLSSGPLGRE